jgi:hypothetical protein
MCGFPPLRLYEPAHFPVGRYADDEGINSIRPVVLTVREGRKGRKHKIIASISS